MAEGMRVNFGIKLRSAIDGLYPYRPFTFASAPLEAPILESRTVFSTPTPSASAGRIEKEVMTLFAAYSSPLGGGPSAPPSLRGVCGHAPVFLADRAVDCR